MEGSGEDARTDGSQGRFVGLDSLKHSKPPSLGLDKKNGSSLCKQCLSTQRGAWNVLVCSLAFLPSVWGSRAERDRTDGTGKGWGLKSVFLRARAKLLLAGRAG